MITYILYDERDCDPPKIQYWTEAEYNDYTRSRAYGFGDAIISGGDVVCRAKMAPTFDQRGRIKMVTQRVTIWMAEQAEIAKSQPKPKKRGKRAKAD